MAHDEDLAVAVEALHQSYATLRKLSGADTDAVVHAGSATTYLFPETQQELRRMERAERRSADERTRILDALPAQMAILDNAGTITAVNETWRAFARAQGYADSSAAVGLNYLSICRTARGRCETGARSVAEGIETVLSGQSPHFSMEHVCETTGGDLWFLLTVVPLSSAQRTGAVVMHLDITERHEAGRREAELRQRIESLTDQAGIGILVHRNNAPLFVNPALVQMLDLPAQQDILALEDVRTLFDLSDGLGIGSSLQTAEVPGAVARQGRAAARRRDGQPVLFETRVFALNWEGGRAVCAMFTDITERLHIEDMLRASQKLEAVGQLTAGVAHDFNNLLTIILGSAEMLSDALRDRPDLARLADQALMAAERGGEMTRRLLAFARLQPLRPQRTDVNLHLLMLQEVLQRTLGDQVVVKMALSDSLWPALIDPVELDNAILNLSLNARDAIPEAGSLAFATANAGFLPGSADLPADMAPGDYVVLRVTDDGTGMAPATLARIFEPFFTTKDVSKGSGLGLSMVFGFVKQSFGHIVVRSVLGQGTTVELYLPRADDPAVAHPPHADTVPGQPSETTIRRPGLV